jgi:hypothetical protein
MQRIAIHSVPRSGSTWLGSIFDSSSEVMFRFQPLFSYAFKSFLSDTSSRTEILQFFDDISQSTDDFITQKSERNEGLIPIFTKTRPTTIVYKEVRYHHILKNMLKEDEEIKAIGLIRNPMSVINSWLNAPKEFKKELGWEVDEEWKYAPAKNLDKPEEFNGYMKWKEVALLFNQLEQEYPERFKIIRYDRLLENTTAEVNKLFNFCDLEVSQQTSDFINLSGSVAKEGAYSVFRNNQTDDRWKKDLPPNIIEQIRVDLKGTFLETYIQPIENR